MNSDKAGGYLFIGAVLVVAAADGAFLAILGAAGLGWLISKRLTKIATRPSEVAIHNEISRIQRDAEYERDPELRKKKIKESDKAAVNMKAELVKLQSSEKEVSKWVGIGSFAAPLVGVSIIAASEFKLRNITRDELSASKALS